uniref:hypothetical protein n=1 Tax=Paenibacillus thermotolerans TaxID=3027807 RepID=UPI0023ED94D6
VTPPRTSGRGKLELLWKQDGLFTLMVRKWFGYRRIDDGKQFFEVKDAEKALTAFSEYWARYDADHDVRALVNHVFCSDAIWEKPLSCAGIDYASFTDAGRE